MKAQKPGLHPRNRHHQRYDLPALCQAHPDLQGYITLNPLGEQTIDFANPQAVKALNKALLAHFYAVKHWDIPDGFLCPPVPGRADYIHHLADLLAGESDFFSIGTNDLTQYTLAADRNDLEVKKLYTPLHPAVLRELREVIRAGRQAGLPVGLCGEAAASPELLPLLLSWGLEEFSVSPALLLETRARIAGWTAEEAGAVERQVMALAGPEEIRAYYDARAYD